jgi:beta-alanine--pyruvate transaminase
MSLKRLPNVLDIRTVGLTAGIDLASLPGGVGQRGTAVMDRAFYDENLVIRATGDTVALTPPLIISEAQVSELFDKVGRAIRAAG